MAAEIDAGVYASGVAPSSPRRKLKDEGQIEANNEIAEESKVYLTVPSKEINARRFVERDYYAIDSKFEYPRNGSDPGLVLIFNQENVPGYKPRRGCKRDINEIVVCLQRQGFNIEERNIINDGTASRIHAKLDEICKMDLSQKNCLIVFFLSHGEELEKLHTSDEVIHTWQIWNKFVACKDLQNKPKMFVFQACKGNSFTTTNTTSAITSSINPYKIFTTSHISADMLVVYSTIEGNVSFRDPVTGSWFIQELCKNFTAYGKRDDVVSLIIRTTKCVCGNYFQYDDEVVQKQMPMFVSTLSKKFYLNRNKDRDLIIRVLESNEEILRMLKNVKEEIDKLYFKDEEKKKKKKKG